MGGLKGPPPLCDFAQWIDTEQSEYHKNWVAREVAWIRELRLRRQQKKEEEEKRKKWQEDYRKRCERIEREAAEEREAERERKRERARRAKEAMEDNPDAARKGKWPRCTQ